MDHSSPHPQPFSRKTLDSDANVYFMNRFASLPANANHRAVNQGVRNQITGG